MQRIAKARQGCRQDHPCRLGSEVTGAPGSGKRSQVAEKGSRRACYCPGKADAAACAIERHTFHGDWNYTIHPGKSQSK